MRSMSFALERGMSLKQKIKTRIETRMAGPQDTTGYGRFADAEDDGTAPQSAQDYATNPLPNSRPAMNFRIQERVKNAVNDLSRRKLILIIVFIALFLDNMLLTTVVPIVPGFLYEIEHPNDTLEDNDDSSNCTCIPKVELDARNAAEKYTKFSGGKLRMTTTASPALQSSTPIDDCGATNVEKHKELISENIRIGLMFASKSIVQLMINPFIGPLTNRIGYTVPLFAGFVIMFTSTLSKSPTSLRKLN